MEKPLSWRLTAAAVLERAGNTAPRGPTQLEAYRRPARRRELLLTRPERVRRPRELVDLRRARRSGLAPWQRDFSVFATNTLDFIQVPGFPSAIRVFALTHSRRKVVQR